jgi:hypothetical protein
MRKWTPSFSGEKSLGDFLSCRRLLCSISPCQLLLPLQSVFFRVVVVLAKARKEMSPLSW